MNYRRAIVILGLLLTQGCGSEQSAARWKGSIDSLASGAVVVSNPATGVWEPGDAWALEQDLLIGKTEDEGADVFGKIEAFAVSATGHIFVLDGQAQDIRQFDERGKYLRTLGRRGSGPGEFEAAYGIAFDPRGNLWVADLGLRRYTVFDSSGKLLRFQRTPMAGFAPPWSGLFDVEGRLYDWDVGISNDGRIRLTALRIDTLGQIDTIPFLGYHIPLVKGWPPLDTAFIARTVAQRDPKGRLWSGNMQNYRFALHSSTGDTLRMIERAFEPLAVQPAEKDAILERYKNGPLRFERSDIPDHRLAIESFGFTRDGHMLVRVVNPPAAQETVFDVFDDEGRYLGQLRVPLRLNAWPAPQIHGEHLLGIALNDLNVDQVVRYRIVRRR
jgi:hypothetical protein